jgi:hypothetical protein
MAMQWYQVLARYEYAMRVDEDVCVTRLPGFVGVLGTGDTYAYGLQTTESHEETVLTFLPWLKAYMNQQSPALTPSFGSLPSSEMYFTNFFVSKIAFWSRPDVQRFLQSVDASSGIFEHRWGGVQQSLEPFPIGPRVYPDRLRRDARRRAPSDSSAPPFRG